MVSSMVVSGGAVPVPLAGVPPGESETCAQAANKGSSRTAAAMRKCAFISPVLQPIASGNTPPGLKHTHEYDAVAAMTGFIPTPAQQ